MYRGHTESVKSLENGVRPGAEAVFSSVGRVYGDTTVHFCYFDKKKSKCYKNHSLALNSQTMP